jgi:hypothetical protein
VKFLYVNERYAPLKRQHVKYSELNMQTIHVRVSHSLRVWTSTPLASMLPSLSSNFTERGKIARTCSPTPTQGALERLSFPIPSGKVQQMERFVLHVHGNVTFHNDGACIRNSHNIRGSIVQDAFNSEEILHTCSTCSKYLQSAKSFSLSRGSSPTQRHLYIPTHLQ